MRGVPNMGGFQVNQSKAYSWLTCADGMASKLSDALNPLARVLFGSIFMMSGWPKLFNVSGVAAGYVSRGIPEVLAYMGPYVEFFGGLALILGFATRYTSILLFIFMLIATFSSHRYWAVDAAQYAAQKNNFWKNLAMMAAPILLFVTGGGKYSIDGILGRKS